MLIQILLASISLSRPVTIQTLASTHLLLTHPPTSLPAPQPINLPLNLPIISLSFSPPKLIPLRQSASTVSLQACPPLLSASGASKISLAVQRMVRAGTEEAVEREERVGSRVVRWAKRKWMPEWRVGEDVVEGRRERRRRIREERWTVWIEAGVRRKRRMNQDERIVRI
jgi:hypothetical protein